MQPSLKMCRVIDVSFYQRIRGALKCVESNDDVISDFSDYRSHILLSVD